MLSQRGPWPEAIELLFRGEENIALSQKDKSSENGLKISWIIAEESFRSDTQL